jgi:hypothetical protein
MGKEKQIKGQLELFDLFEKSLPSMKEVISNNKIKEDIHLTMAKAVAENKTEISCGRAERFPISQNKDTMSEINFFMECYICWCRGCMHNQYGKAIPRDLCGKWISCPACEECRKEGRAEVCEIGSAENGCMTRAIETGQVLEER